MPFQLETERLILRSLEMSDLDNLTAMNQDPEVMRFFPALQDKAYTERLIERMQKQQALRNYSCFACELKQDKQFIGFVGLNYVDFPAAFTPTTEIGWRLAKAYWHKGYATEAATKVLEYGFTDLKLPEIVAFTIPANTPSQNVMDKIGLIRDLEGDFDHPFVEENNPARKHILYRLTQANWENKGD